MQETYLKAFRAADQLRAGHEPEGLVVHDSPQHRAQPAPAIAPATPVAVDSDARRPARPISRRPARRGAPRRPKPLLLRDTLAPELQAAIDALAGRVPAGGLVTRRGRVFLRRNRRDAADSDRHGDVAHLARPPCMLFEPAATELRSPVVSQRNSMNSCHSIDPLVTPFIDGELADADRRARRRSSSRAARRAIRASPPSSAVRDARAHAQATRSPRCARRTALRAQMRGARVG